MSFATQLARRGISSTSAVMAQVVVIGGGLMGSGIAQVAAMKGNETKLVDVSDKILDNSRKMIASSLTRIQNKFSSDPKYGYLEGSETFMRDAMGRIQMTTDMRSAVADAAIVIESIIENLDAKQKLFKEIDNLAPPQAVFASNTSSLSIAEIASATNRKDRFAGLHFFNPVPIMKLVEVIRTDETSEGTHHYLWTFCEKLAKHPVASKDTPGFIVNRLLVPYLMEAIRMYERGDSTVRDIDDAMKHGAGYPMGPFELADFVGLDINKSIIDGWYKKHPDNAMFAPSKTLDRLVAEGKLGRKAGEGFYKWKK